MNDQQAVDTLLSSHVDPNRFNRISPLHVSNPLHIAAVNGNKNIVNILLRHGANPQIQSPDPKENFLLFAVSLLKTSKTCNHALPMLQTCLNFRHSTSVPMYAITSILAYCAQEPLPLFAQQPTVDIVRYLLGKYPGTLLYHQGKPLYLNATNTKVKDILRKHFNSRTMPGSTYNKRRRSVRSSGRTLIRQ